MPRMVKPKKLEKGGTVEIISPASADTLGKFDKAVNALENSGYIVRTGEHARGKFGYFSGSDDQRSSDFNAAVKDKEVSAIIASRAEARATTRSLT